MKSSDCSQFIYLTRGPHQFPAILFHCSILLCVMLNMRDAAGDEIICNHVNLIAFIYNSSFLFWHFIHSKNTIW
jgi:hypothetical protein